MTFNPVGEFAAFKILKYIKHQAVLLGLINDYIYILSD